MTKRHWLIIFIIFILTHGLIFARSIPSPHNALSATHNKWKEVDISYDHDFPYKECL